MRLKLFAQLNAFTRTASYTGKDWDITFAACHLYPFIMTSYMIRDLKPENIILDSTGNLKITDFGLSKQGLTNDESKTYSFCGTPEYLAPEIITGQGHDKSVDWWSLGALIYEMLSGRPPHYSKNRKQMMQDIVEKRIEMKAFFSVEAKSLLQGLLERDPAKRLGSTEEDANELKRHPWFAKIDWQKLMLK